MANVTFANSYNITNRYDPFTWWVDSTTYVVPLPSPSLLYYMSPGVMYDTTPDDYNSYPASSFFPQLIDDLKQTVDSTGRANLVLYIHGLGNTYSDALTAAANLGTTLQAAGYGGLVMGFSWPSYSELVAALTSYYATTRPPVATSGTIRDNINGSVGSFLAMLAQLQAIKINSNPINISVVTHSEGNFMLMWGMAQYKNSPPLNHSFMLAADISAAMLQGGQTGVGITSNFQDVNVYFSGCDPDLTYSDYEFFAYHDQSYPTRLGLIGPFGYPAASPVAKNVTGLDCSQVTVNLGDILDVHSSYMSLPPVIADITSILNGTKPSGRTQYPGTSSPWYYLNPSQATHEGIKALWSGQVKIHPKFHSITRSRVRCM